MATPIVYLFYGRGCTLSFYTPFAGVSEDMKKLKREKANSAITK